MPCGLSLRTLTTAFGLLTLLAPAARASDPLPNPAALKFFETRIRPVLAGHCWQCHGKDRHRAELRLDSRAAVLKGGISGPAVRPGDPEASLLVKAVRWQDPDLRMPRKERLTRQQVEDLTAWVRIGAPWPAESPAQVAAKDGKAHWAFQSVGRPAIPAVRDTVWAANPIDAFVLARLEARGLRPSPAAEKRELLRRVTFDLIGLPPTPAEVESFLADPSPDAYARRVRELLSRPQYGERWARHLLDVFRYAQTSGYERDNEKPGADRFRDYLIKSLNEDRPYDQLVREMIAGDELDTVTDASLTATAFWHLGVWDDEPDDARQAEFDDLDDMLSTVGEAFLGLTVGCARCHDHKFDPIPQKDYYGLLALIRNVKRYNPKVNLVALPSGGHTLAVREDGPKVRPTHVLFAGQAARVGPPVEPHFPRALCRSDAEAEPRGVRPTARTSGRRRALAEWVAGKENPLTARVIVNRLWQHHFGQGLVTTPNDFGTNGNNGAPVSHPELLDWLASELVEGGWRLKRIHERIVLSSTYQQSSRVRDERASRADPDNTLLWRQRLRRLEAEALRDAILSVSGRLNLKMGGRGVFPALPREVLETQSVPGRGWDLKCPPREQDRRSVYIFVKRTLGVPLLEVFDFPSPDRPAPQRATTTIAPQALILLNSAFMEEQAAAFADRLLRDSAEPARNVEQAYRLALGRPPTAAERAIALDYLRRAGGRAGLARLCRLVLNLNEFAYVD